MIIDRLRQDASFMRVLPRASGWQKALLIDEVEVQKISATMLEAAERLEALEARATPALPKDDSASPDGYAEGWSAARRAMLNGAFETKVPQVPDTHRVVSVELLKEAVGQLSELNTFAAIRAIIEAKP